MSNLLTDALIDAEALRETALKNAEAILLEKFSDQIKDAVETILTEAPEDEMMPMDTEEDPMAADAEEMPADEEGALDDIEAVPDMPLASAEGVEMCPCPDNEKIVKIDFDELEAEIGDLESSEEAAEDMPMDGAGEEAETLDLSEEELQEMSYDYSEDVDLEEEVLRELSGMLEEEESCGDNMGMPCDAEAEEASERAAAAGGESSDLEATTQAGVQRENVILDDDELLAELVEALKVDINPLQTEKSGWMNTPQGTFQLAEKELLAMLQDSEVREQHDEMNKALKKLQETSDKLKKDKKELLSITGRMKKQLKESNLTNSKLLYTNKVLMSDSLNERQKEKIAEALSNAETVEEAKTIYETLQSATGSTIQKRKPESLSEAVSKTTSTLILSHRKRDKEEKTQNSPSDRWKILAGLK